jgi:hypothetical protein
MKSEVLGAKRLETFRRFGMNGLRILVISFALALSACGNDGDNTQAQVPGPEYGQSCVQNGGYGCSTQQYPQGFYAYPTYPSGQYAGYYMGYAGNNTYTNFSACSAYYGSSYQTFYYSGYGLGCVQMQQSYYQYNYRPYYYTYAGYNAYTYCSPGTACPGGQHCIQCGTNAGYCGY